MNRNILIILGSILTVGLFMALIVFLSVEDEKTPNQDGTISISQADLEEGRRLSQKYCASCHTYPNPSLLSKQTWRDQTLPHMGPQLGIFEHEGVHYPVERTPNLPENYYPDEPQLSKENWQKIIGYYLASSPEELKRDEGYTPIRIDSLFFQASTPSFRDQTPPMVSSIRFDSANGLIYLSDASNNNFYVYDQDLHFKDRYQLSSAISDIRFMNEASVSGRRELLTTYIGSVNPSDAQSGFIQPVWYDPEGEQGGPGKILHENLARPVESQSADLNGDGIEDLLVNEFAHRTGKLFWLAGRDGGGFARLETLIESSGCIESKVLDFTGDDNLDIVVLCTQLDQSIYLFENDPESSGAFSRSRLLQFPITAGSSSFKLVDFNNDSHLDILYTSGDNADYSIAYKPYHGVYIYLNDRNNNFEEAWFYPMNGAYDAVARDFDRDGHLDIAAISFFADYGQRPEEGFIYFKGEGELDFEPFHHPAANAGRWIAMDVADWNGNGYDDIVLANFSKGPTSVANHIQNNWLNGPHFLFLNNQGFTE